MIIKSKQIEENLLGYIQKEFLPNNSKFSPGYEDNLFDQGIVDSAGLISLIAFIETEFKITIPDEDLLPENFKSISATAEYLRSKTKRSKI